MTDIKSYQEGWNAQMLGRFNQNGNLYYKMGVEDARLRSPIKHNRVHYKNNHLETRANLSK